MNNKRSLSYSTFVLTLANTVTRILGFAYRVFLSRLVGAEGMGLFSLVMPIYSIAATIISSGIPTSVLRMVSERGAVHDAAGIRRVMSVASRMVAVVSVVLAAAVFLFSAQLAAVLGDARTTVAISVLSICILITGFENIFKCYFYAINRVYFPSIAEVLEQVVRICAVVAILTFARPGEISIILAVLVFGMILGEGVSGAFLWVAFSKSGAHRGGERPAVRGIATSIMGIAVPLTLTRLTSAAIHSLNSVVIPQRLVVFGMSFKDALSTFGVMSGMVMPLLMLPFTLISALSIMIIPKISANLALSNSRDTQSKISKAIFATAIAVFPCVGLLAALSHPIGTVLYHQSDVGAYLFPMSFAVVFLSFGHIFSSILNGLNRQKQASAYAIVGGLIQLGLTYFLTAKVGIGGFIFGFLFCSVVLCGLNFSAILRCVALPLKPVQWFSKPLVATVLSYFCTGLALQHTSVLTPSMSLLVSAIVGVFVYAAALLVQGTVVAYKRA